MDCPDLLTCRHHPAYFLIYSSSSVWLLPSAWLDHHEIPICVRSSSIVLHPFTLVFSLHFRCALSGNIISLTFQLLTGPILTSQGDELGAYAWLDHHNISIPVFICSSSIALHPFRIFPSFSLCTVWQPNGNIPLSAVSCLIWPITSYMSWTNGTFRTSKSRRYHFVCTCRS